MMKKNDDKMNIGILERKIYYQYSFAYSLCSQVFSCIFVVVLAFFLSNM